MGLEHIIAKSTKWAVAAVAMVLLAVAQDATTVYFLLCSALAAFTARTLKAVLDVKRPDGSTLMDPGMPSSHGLLLAFFAVVVAHELASATRPCTEPGTDADGCLVRDPTMRRLLAAATLLLALVLSVVRIRVGHHTHAQVAVGVSIGTTAAWLALALRQAPEAWLAAELQAHRGAKCVGFGIVGIGALVAKGVFEKKLVLWRDERRKRDM